MNTFNRNTAKDIFADNREIIIAEIKKRGGDVAETMNRMLTKWSDFLLPIEDSIFSVAEQCEFHAGNCIVKPRAERAANANALHSYHRNVTRSIMGAR
jgi:hypothetical protein